MSFSYEIREIQRPDGRKIWRLYEKTSRHEQGIAAFDSFADAQRFCRVSKKQLDRHALNRQNKLNAEETS